MGRKPDWSQVKLVHIRRAFKMFDTGEALPRRKVHSLFVYLDGKSYPAKFIRRLAYQVATGNALDASQSHTRNEATISFFEKHGLAVRKVVGQLIRQPDSLTPPEEPKTRQI